jgi:pimeloyl-ACP methyl ester carboxylesterase
MVNKRVAITLHGIRTHGIWQKSLDTVLAANDIIPYPLDYGYFDTLSFLNPWKRRECLDWLLQQYNRVVSESGVKRPSIIAHSFGTYLTAKMMEQYPEIKFDKIIFAGAIVNRDYNWDICLQNDQVLLVCNEYATGDLWPKVAGWIPGLKAGASGRAGFSTVESSRFLQNKSIRGHEVAAYTTHFNNWVQLLRKPLLCKSDQETISQVLGLAPSIVARALDIPKQCLRSNIFVRSEKEGELIIPCGLFYNMTDVEERNIPIPMGLGCTGKAFADRRVHIAIFKDGFWDEHDLPSDLLRLVNRDLRWIISFPIFDPTDGRIRGTMTIDCLSKEKTLSELTAEEADVQGNFEHCKKLKKMYNDIGVLIKMVTEHLSGVEQGVL